MEYFTFMERKNIIIAVLLVAVAALGINAYMPKQRQITELEQAAVDSFSSDIMNYMEEIDITAKDEEEKLKQDVSLSDISLDRYIAFALQYSVDKNDKYELTTKEIKNLVKKIFDVELDTDKINKVGVSPLLLDKHIDHEPVGQIYSLRKEIKSKQKIANTPIAKYIQRNTELSGDDYVVTFDKYVAKNPYDVLPHSNQSNIKTKAYLDGEGKINDFKKLINADNADKVGAKEKQTIIKLTVKNGKLIIKSVY